METPTFDQMTSTTMEKQLLFSSRESAAQLAKSDLVTFLRAGAADVQDTKHNASA